MSIWSEIETPRRAVIVGINKYDDDDITDLAGAENDANEMYDKLTQYGDFEIVGGKMYRLRQLRTGLSTSHIHNRRWESPDHRSKRVYGMRCLLEKLPDRCHLSKSR